MLQFGDGLSGMHLTECGRGRSADLRLGIGESIFRDLAGAHIILEQSEGTNTIGAFHGVLGRGGVLQHVPGLVFGSLDIVGGLGGGSPQRGR